VRQHDLAVNGVDVEGAAVPDAGWRDRGRVADPGVRASDVSNAIGLPSGGTAPITDNIATEFALVRAILDGPVFELDRGERRRMARRQALTLLAFGSLLTLLAVGLARPSMRPAAAATRSDTGRLCGEQRLFGYVRSLAC
jgi:hypothetical protein